MKPPSDDPSSTTIRPPTPADGATMWQLARDSGGLDLNSPYAYLLAGHHFAETSVVAATPDGRLVGFVMAYRPTSEPTTVFVWQVTVDPSQRGTGIGKRMLHAVIDQALPLGVSSMTATVTPSNDASRHLFTAVAKDRDTEIVERELFGAELFPGEGHEGEHELLIGPLHAPDATQTAHRKDHQ